MCFRSLRSLVRPPDHDAIAEPVITRPDPMSAEEWQAWLECELDEGPDPEEVQYEDDFLPAGELELTEAELAEIAGAMEARTAAGADPAGVAGCWPRRRPPHRRGGRDPASPVRRGPCRGVF